MKKILLDKNKEKVQEDLDKLKEAGKVSRENGNDLVLVVEDEKAKELTQMYEGLEEMNE